jgi:DNA polymerase
MGAPRQPPPDTAPAGCSTISSTTRIDLRNQPVKHFKWIAKGKRRIHQRPDASELAACRPWLEAELALLEPQVLLCLGATAARAVIGPSFRVTRHRGRFLAGEETRLEGFGGSVTATLHPSALLRIREDEERREATRGVLADLRAVTARLAD